MISLCDTFILLDFMNLKKFSLSSCSTLISVIISSSLDFIFFDFHLCRTLNLSRYLYNNDDSFLFIFPMFRDRKAHKKVANVIKIYDNYESGVCMCERDRFRLSACTQFE